MRDQDGGLVLPPYDAEDFVGHAQARLVVECGKRLVEQQQRGIKGERTDESHFLPHAARQLAGIVPPERAEAVGVDQPERVLLPLRGQQVLDLQREQDVFFHRAPVQQVVPLEHVAHAGVAGAGRLAHDEDAAGRRLDQAHQQRQHGGLAAAGRPDDGDKFALFHGKGQPFHGKCFRVLFLVGERYVLYIYD